MSDKISIGEFIGYVTLPVLCIGFLGWVLFATGTVRMEQFCPALIAPSNNTGIAIPDAYKGPVEIFRNKLDTFDTFEQRAVQMIRAWKQQYAETGDIDRDRRSTDELYKELYWELAMEMGRVERRYILGEE